jgi:Membrane protein involved in the export of O-antigen and teichoic acid
MSGVLRRVRGEDRGAGARLKAIAHLLTGNFLGAALMLVSIAIAARTLSPDRYGVMVMVLSFSRLVERILRFESWQALIRFAAQYEDKADNRQISRLYAYGLLIDAGAAALAAVASIGLAVLGGKLFGLAPIHVDLVAIYAVALLFNIAGVPTAALRLAGKFKLLAYAQLIANVLRIALAAICAWWGAGLLGFMAAWTISQVTGSAIIFWLGLQAIAARGIPSPFRASIRHLRRDFPGFFGFTCSTNLSLTLRVVTTEADSLFVGAVAGSSAAGIYHLAKRIAKVAVQVGAQVQAVVYPDVARMWARGDVAGFRRATLQTQAALAAVGVAILAAATLIAPLVLNWGLGAAYMSAYPLLMTQLVAVILTLHAAPSRSALLAMNESWRVLMIAFGGTFAFVVVAVYAVPRWGAIGANAAHIVLAGTVALALEIALLSRIRSKRPDGAAAST